MKNVESATTLGVQMERLDIQSFTTDPIKASLSLRPLGGVFVQSRSATSHLSDVGNWEVNYWVSPLWANHRPFFPKVLWLLWVQGSKSQSKTQNIPHTSSIQFHICVAPERAIQYSFVPLSGKELIKNPLWWDEFGFYMLGDSDVSLPTIGTARWARFWAAHWTSNHGLPWIPSLHRMCFSYHCFTGAKSWKKNRSAIYCHRHYHRDQIIVILILSIDHHSLWYYHHDSFQPWTPNDPRVLQRAPGTAGPKRHNARCLTDWLHTRPVSQTMWATDRLLLETKTNMKYVVDIIGYLWWWCRQATKPSTKNKFGILPYPLCK